MKSLATMLLAASAGALALSLSACGRVSLPEQVTDTRDRVLTAASLQEEGPDWPSVTRFESAIEEFEAQDAESFPPKGAILAIGSSSMRGWHGTIQEDLGFEEVLGEDRLHIIPRGFGGSMISDVIHYADRIVLPYEPKAILLYEGDNDVYSGIQPERIAARYIEFFEIVHEELPETRIFVLSVKPSPARWNVWPEMQETNALLKAICEEDERLVFIDVSTPMLDEDSQTVDELYLSDGVHMTRAGYEVWTDAVRNVLAQYIAVPMQ